MAGFEQKMGKKSIPPPQITRRLLFTTCFWIMVIIVLFMFLVGSSSSANQEPVNNFTFPKSPPNTYCDVWRQKYRTFGKTVWFDRPSAYSAKRIVKHGGWKEVESPDTAIGRKFDGRENDLNNLREDVQISRPSSFESDKGLYYASPEARFIFTRMYFYKDANEENSQTARLGIDYACPGQILNHVPGASGFCRKDYMQMYLKAYKAKYLEDSNPQCYQDVTPKSYILTDADHCEEYLDVIKDLIDEYGENLPIRYIHKNSVRHKGYGIELVDYAYATKLLAKYRGPTRCEQFVRDKDNVDMVAQQYIHNPALIAGRKFDFRVYMLIVQVNPLIVLWAPENGHSRVSDVQFDATSSDFTTHITANVHTDTEEEAQFILDHRFNLRELGIYFKDKVGETQEWLDNFAFPKVKNLLIHMVRASQQNFVVKRPGLLEFYGVDLIMEDNLQHVYLLESNRRPNVQEENPKLKYREDGIVDDFTRVANFIYDSDVTELKSDYLYPKLEYFVPLIDETKDDPYFGMLAKECQNINVKDYDGQLPLDPMLDPLVHHFLKIHSGDDKFLN